MATLILTAVGTAIGGPVGGAIGALIGGTVDRGVLSAPGRRDGPRLTELAVQTSSYATQIPKLFGTVRVAGTVIWSTDLIESRSTGRTGKGQPSVTSYSYSASFAVLLSARPVARVGRIWADGNLLRGAGGDFKVATGFRLHLGSEEQDVDPLIASAVGTMLAPAHRGCAYAVFENLPLGGFGNRIPSLTFEVVADEEAPTAGGILAALVPEVAGEAPLAIGGFAASGGSVGAVADLLATAAGASLAPSGGRLLLDSGTTTAATLVDEGVSAGGRGARRRRTVAAIETVPAAVAVTHYDPLRDYQAGVQRARRPGAGEREQRLDLPAALDAGTAKTVADAVLARAEAARTRRVVSLGLGGMAICPGTRVALAAEGGVWRVEEAAVERFVTSLTLVAMPSTGPALSASSGTVLPAPDQLAGRTVLAAFEVPAGDETLSTPRLAVAATGSGAGWRSAALLLSADGSAAWSEAGSTAAPAVIGTVVEPPLPAPSTLFDCRGGIVVDLARDDSTLTDADDGRLDAGANAALVGEEVIQFGRAEPLGRGRWRLSRLLRGRHGTEAGVAGQRAGAAFVLLDPPTLRTLDLPLAQLGATARIMATGAGDGDTPAVAAVAVTGRSILPPAPVHLRADRLADDRVRVTWARRSRAGWRWIDGVDVPLVEERERYRVTITAPDSPGRSVEVDQPQWLLVAADRPAARYRVAVVQLGTWGESPAAFIDQGSLSNE